MNEHRIVPIYVDGTYSAAMAMTVEVDAAGEAWLTPEQIDELTARRKYARAYSRSIVIGANKLRRRSRKVTPPTIDAGAWIATAWATDYAPSTDSGDPPAELVHRSPSVK